jgi:hypothetical protein
MATRLAERRQMKQDILQLLDGLGRTPGSVADSLSRSGVQGHQYSLTDCPVARYTNAILAGDPRCGSVRVGMRHLRVGHPWRLGLRVSLPIAVRSFIMRFDEGEYPAMLAAPVQHPLLRDPLDSPTGI